MRIVLALIVLVVLVALIRGAIRPVVVYEFERGLRYTRGKFIGVLGPGLYWLLSRF